MAMAMVPTVPMAMATGPMAMAIVMTPEQAQAYHIRQFSLRAVAIMTSSGDLWLSSAAALAALVIEATAHPDIFDFSHLLCLPEISWLKQTEYYWVFDTLCVFAYGTLKDYIRHNDILPQLNSEQLKKMRHITLLTAMESRKMILIVEIMKELDIATNIELEEILDHSAQKLGTVVNLNLHSGFLEVHHAPEIRGSLFSGVSLEVYFQAATVSHVDAGILSNDIVTQVQVPLCRTGSQVCWKVDFTSDGRETFIQLISLTSSGHLSQKSWNGLIYPGMFGSFRGKIFLRPGAEPYRMITDPNSMNDYAAIDNMIGEYAGLKFPYIGKSGKMEQIMFPIYLDDLRAHLQGKTNQLAQNSGIRALDLNLITFLECHPSLLTSSAKSVVFEHVRRQYKTSDPKSVRKFSARLRSFTPNFSRKWKKNIQTHWLFEDVFKFASRHKSHYGGSAFDCQRYIRDWETHGRENLSAIERSLFTTEVCTYIVEHFLGNFVPEVLYVLVCGPPVINLNMTIWLSKLQRTSRGC